MHPRGRTLRPPLPPTRLILVLSSLILVSPPSHPLLNASQGRVTQHNLLIQSMQATQVLLKITLISWIIYPISRSHRPRARFLINLLGLNPCHAAPATPVWTLWTNGHFSRTFPMTNLPQRSSQVRQNHHHNSRMKTAILKQCQTNRITNNSLNS